MSKDFSQSASSEQSEPKWPFTVRRRDTSVLKNDPANLCIAYLAADSALSSAKPGTSPEELSEMRMRSSKALRVWQEADDLWEKRLDDLVSSKYREIALGLSILTLAAARARSTCGKEPISGQCYEAEPGAETIELHATMKTQDD